MALFTDTERATALALAKLAFSNPFLPERIALEKQVLGDAFVEAGAKWNVDAHSGAMHPNLEQLQMRTESLATTIRQRLSDGEHASEQDLSVYETLILLVLYYRYRERFADVISDAQEHPTKRRTADFYDDYVRDATHFLGLPNVQLPLVDQLPHIFACYFQIRRAFFEVFNNIIGISGPIVRLRAAVWQSLFSHDMQRYRRVLYRRTSDITTLITGPSGTGKELVARSISLSRYIPFDPKARRFVENYTGLFHALNISALSPTLVESELFGHRRGAFTGAVADRAGWLEQCSPLGTVFLDEIGDLDSQIQVKLLRVLQTRTFQPIGETKTRNFQGKIIAATNRDIEAKMSKGDFRSDFYYRLCSDLITTPSLHDQLQDSPQELGTLILFLAGRVVGEDEAAPLAGEVERWIEQHLGADYRWPGNVRELEQCVRNVTIRGEYRPIGSSPADPRHALAHAVTGGKLKVEELLRHYCTMVYAQCGSYEQAAERLGVDRRTVKARIDHELLARLNGTHQDAH